MDEAHALGDLDIVLAMHHNRIDAIDDVALYICHDLSSRAFARLFCLNPNLPTTKRSETRIAPTTQASAGKFALRKHGCAFGYVSPAHGRSAIHCVPDVGLAATKGDEGKAGDA